MSSLNFATAVAAGPTGLQALVRASRRNYILWRFLVLGSLVGGGAGVGALLLNRIATLIRQRAESRRKRKLAEQTQQRETDKSSGGKNKVAVDKIFYARLRLILGICIPRIRSKPMVILTMHSLFLILRTYLSIIVARLDGRLVKDLVAANGREFLKGLGYWFAVAIPATYTNSMIKYCQSKLAIALRTGLTNHVHELYMQKNNYYKAINLDNRIGNSADQLITTDINKFCDALASLYSNLGKPVLDIVIFNYQLVRSIGSRGMWGIVINYIVTANIMRAITPSFGKMAAEEARLEGNFRTAHSRLITNAEEIAFYNGASMEKSILTRTYTELIRHINHVYKVRIGYNMLEDFIIKYCWSAVGLLIASIPVFFPQYAGTRHQREERKIQLDSSSSGASGMETARTGNRTQGFITNKRLMVGLADAGGRIMYSYKELSELAGYTSRVYNLIEVLNDLNSDKFVITSSSASQQQAATVISSIVPSATMLSSTLYKKPSTPQLEKFDIRDVKGSIEYGKQAIAFEKIPIVTPAGDTLLIQDLSFSIRPGNHLMITGSNGSGKTSILRVLAGLWPIFRGKLERPDANLKEIMYIPQRPYLSIGTLRDQIIYPHTLEDMREAGKTDQEIFHIMKLVYLDYIPEREGGLDAVKGWKDVFSGGEKQRVQMARLFYHHPKFVVLDEATSAVSPDVEALMYGTAQEEGITIITISHRPSLFKYHTLLLKVGEGANGNVWILQSIGSSNNLIESVETEIRKIEDKLESVVQLKRRLDDICVELKLKSASQGSGGDKKSGDLRHAKRTVV